MRPTYPLFQLGIDDPIRAAQLRDEYHEYVERLFEPIDKDLQERPMAYLVEGFLPKGYLAILASAPSKAKHVSPLCIGRQWLHLPNVGGQ